MKRILIAVLTLAIGFALPALAQKVDDINLEIARADWPCNQQGDAGLCLPLDTTWDVVEFIGGGADCFENDDDSSALISLGFTFDLFGSPQTACYINNFIF